MNTTMIIIFLTLLNFVKIASANVDMAASPISSISLTGQVSVTPLNSSKNQELLARAQISHLQKLAYDLYTKKWQENQHNPYANLWRGVAADRYFQYLMAPSSHLTNVPNAQVNTLYEDAALLLYYAYQEAPKSALTNMYYGSFLFWIDASSNEKEAKGLALMRNAVKLEQKNSSVHANLGDAYAASYRSAYDPVLARKELSEAIRLNPISSFSYWRLTELDMSLGNYQKASKELNIYVKLISPERASGTAIQAFRVEIRKHTATRSGNIK